MKIKFEERFNILMKISVAKVLNYFEFAIWSRSNKRDLEEREILHIFA